MKQVFSKNVVQGCACFLAIIFLFRLLVDIANTYWGTGKPFFADFVSFWTAAHSVIGGDPTLPYLFDDFSDRQMELFGLDKFAFFYPPTWLLYLLPFGLLPYELSVVLFQGLSLAAACAALAALARDRQAAWMVLAFPGLMFAFLHGQNGLLNVALLGGAIAALDRGRFVLAGILIGLLAYKPHLGVLIPFALLAGREWRVFASAVLTTLAAGLASFLAFWVETWIAFLDQAPLASRWLLESWGNMGKYASAFGWLRQYDAPVELAFAVQAVVSATALAAVLWSWGRNIPISVKGAVLGSAVCIATPFVLDYDLALLSIPLVLIVRMGLESSFLRFERELLVLASVTLLFSNGWGLDLDQTLIAVSPLLFFALSLRRAIESARVSSGGAQAEQGEAACAPAE